MDVAYNGVERRQFARLNYVAPLAYKVCRTQTLDKILQGYTSDVSPSGLFCRINEVVHRGDILWLSFNRSTLNICEELERRALIYQNGVIGKVVRVFQHTEGSYGLGVRFITREERNLSNIYPKVHFTLKEPAEKKNV